MAANPPLFDPAWLASDATSQWTLRDLFAAAALAGFITRSSGVSDEHEAARAYRIADAMLAEREKA